MQLSLTNFIIAIERTQLLTSSIQGSIYVQRRISERGLHQGHRLKA